MARPRTRPDPRRCSASSPPDVDAGGSCRCCSPRLPRLFLGLAAGVVIGRDSDPSVTTEQLADAAFDDPSSRSGVLAGTAPDDATVAVAIATDGAGYLDAGALPPLPAGRTYQLWSVTDDAVLSLAVLGPAPTIVGFPAGADVHTLAITDEVAPGVVATTEAPVVSGTVA